MAIELRTIHLGTKVEASSKRAEENPALKTINKIFQTAQIQKTSAVVHTGPLAERSKAKESFPDFQTTVKLACGLYKGCHQNGVPFGYGEMAFSQQDLDKRKVYRGNHKDGKAHGSGELTWQNGITYKGGFKEDEITGIGIIKWPDGTEFNGTFTNRKKEGDYQYDQITGNGLMKWSDGTFYEGVFVQGKITGSRQIKLKFDSGDEYTGDYVNGKMHGKGIYKFSNGDRYVGDFSLGKMTGHGTKYNITGTIFAGTWENGKWVCGTESYDESENKKRKEPLMQWSDSEQGQLY